MKWKPFLFSLIITVANRGHRKEKKKQIIDSRAPQPHIEYVRVARGNGALYLLAARARKLVLSEIRFACILLYVIRPENWSKLYALIRG